VENIVNATKHYQKQREYNMKSKTLFDHQNDPVPSATVLNLRQQVLSIVQMNLPASPSIIDESSGLWMFEWENLARIEIAGTKLTPPRLIGFERLEPAPSATSIATSIPKEQAITKALGIVQQLGYSLTHHVMDAEWEAATTPQPENQPNWTIASHWGVGFTPKPYGFRSLAGDGGEVGINAQNGQIDGFAWANLRTYLPNATNTIISPTQAKALAKQAIVQWGCPTSVEPYGILDLDGSSGDPNPAFGWHYLRLSDYAKVGYKYRFDYSGENEVAIDAETGEVWWIRGLTDGSRPAKPSRLRLPERTLLLQKIQPIKPYLGVTRALWAGSSLKQVVKTHLVKKNASRSFACKTAARAIPFIWSGDKRELYWETETKGKWAGVKLAKSEADTLAAWLKTAKV
jgi:hypothetical protein